VTIAIAGWRGGRVPSSWCRSAGLLETGKLWASLATHPDDSAITFRPT
jgi:hypothetical protein